MMNDDWLVDHRDTIEPDDEVQEEEASKFVRLFAQLHRQVADLEQTEHELLKVLYGPSGS